MEPVALASGGQSCEASGEACVLNMWRNSFECNESTEGLVVKLIRKMTCVGNV